MIDGARSPAFPRLRPLRRAKMLTHFNNITLRCEGLFTWRSQGNK